jgi:hypothetical protein
MNMHMKNINKFANLTDNLKQFNSTYQTLEELNQILKLYLPEHLVKFCHIGAIDIDKNWVVLFVSEQQAYHTIHNMAHPILQHLSKHNHSFDSILIKVRQYKAQHDSSEKYKQLDSKYKNKLKEIAAEINKPELIINISNKLDKEIYF